MRVALAMMAHPDDAEILCGGLLCLLRDRGWTIRIVTSTLGDCGSATLPRDEIAAIRRREAIRAAELLDGAHRTLGLGDLAVFANAATIAEANAVLREERAGVVITHSPSDYMLDHEETSRIARAACFNAPIPNAPVSRAAAPLESIPTLLYADPVEGKDPLGREVAPSLVVDTTAVIDRKCELLACHESQREWLRRHHGIDEYLDGMKRWSSARGATVGLAHGEGYRQHLGHAYPQDDFLGTWLGPELCLVPPRGGRHDTAGAGT